MSRDNPTPSEAVANVRRAEGKPERSEHGHHEWCVVVKLKDQEDMGATILEQLSEEVAKNLDPQFFESTHVAFIDVFCRPQRPAWTTDRAVGTGRKIPANGQK